mgnify:FL=1
MVAWPGSQQHCSQTQPSEGSLQLLFNIAWQQSAEISYCTSAAAAGERQPVLGGRQARQRESGQLAAVAGMEIAANDEDPAGIFDAAQSSWSYAQRCAAALELSGSAKPAVQLRATALTSVSD